MIEALAQLLPVVQGNLVLGFLVFLRVGSAMALLPGLGEQMIPVRIRLAASVAISLTILPIASQEIGPVLGRPLLVLGTIEVAAGLVMGLFLRLFVHALQIAGTIAAQSVSLSQILGPTNVDPVPALGQVLVIGGLALAFLLGLHVRLVEYLILSYQLIPPGIGLSAQVFVQLGISKVAYIFGLAFALSGPFVIASVIYNIALGVINRAMPQLMVAFVGAPAITAGGLIILMGSAPLLLQIWADLLLNFVANPRFEG